MTHEISFNPTMVRLLQIMSVTVISLLAEFQSHNGAIAADRGKVFSSRRVCCFNPTMVRLLPITVGSPVVAAAKFQSHNGAIAAEMVLDIDNFGLTLFQSHNGAIAAGSKLHGRIGLALVSIPQWCDCCPSFPPAPNGAGSFQSHNGAIAA